MNDKDRVLYDCGPIGPKVLKHDLLNPMHLRYTARLDHEIDGDLLREAWERTKRVYPILDCVLEFDDGDADLYRDPSWRERHDPGNVYFKRAEGGSNVPVKSKAPMAPGTDAVGKRLIAITYYGDTIWASVFHSLVDGGGFKQVFSTLIYSYLAIYTGHEDERPVVELREGRPVEEYYVPIEPRKLLEQEYTDVPLYAAPLPDGMNGFQDKDMRNDKGSVYIGVMYVDAGDFMHLCKSNGANPSAMTAALFGRAAYALNPDQQEDIVFEFTISSRSVLGLEDSIANVAIGGFSYATRDDIEHKPLSEVTRHIRSELDAQRTRDYTISFVKHARVEGHMPTYIPFIITYMGRQTIGDNDKHVIDMGPIAIGACTVYLTQTNDHFAVVPLFGRATQKFLDELDGIFAELGVRARIVQQAHPVGLDVETPVL